MGGRDCSRAGEDFGLRKGEGLCPSTPLGAARPDPRNLRAPAGRSPQVSRVWGRGAQWGSRGQSPLAFPSALTCGGRGVGLGERWSIWRFAWLIFP
jgi:hypothetical protein